MPRRPWFWWLAVPAAVLVLLDVHLATVRLRSSATRLPERGAVRERLPGLMGEVQVRLDGHGVAHVTADADWDLWLAQGFLEARDRFLQMELARRTANGRLAEVLGPDALASDTRMRTLQVHAIARRQVGLLSGTDRLALEAYTAGVNAAVDRFGSWVAPELWLLGVNPEPWRAEDSLALWTLLHLRLSPAAAAELERAVQLARLGRRAAVELWGWDPAQEREWLPQIQYAPSPFAPEDAVMPPGPRLAPICWAVAGARSASGLPVLVAALQWVPEQPSPWYLVDLRARELHVAGASLPGVPGVVVGHTEEVAWALTPSLVDDQDLFVLTVDGQRARELVDGRWRPMRTVTERISIRGDEAPVLLKVRLSERGPIVRDGAREVLAMSWTGSHGPSPVAAFLAMARARSVSAVATAWDGVVGPPLDLVAADISGRVLHQLVGLVPDRGFGAGRVPTSGQDARFAWRGFLPVAVNPRTVDPAEGYLVVAGHDRWAEGDAPSVAMIPGEYAPPWRARRVRGQLALRNDWDVASSLELLADRVSLQARTALTVLRPELERLGGRTAESLLDWDGSMDADREEPHLYHRLMAELGTGVGGDEAYRAGLVRSPFGPEEVLRLLAGGMDESWWNDRRTAGVESSNQVLREALARVDEHGLVERWGGVHQVELEHPLARMDLVGPVFSRLWSRGPFAVGGDETTVAASPSSAHQPFRVSSMPSLKVVMPVGRWDETVVAAPPGQSGQPWSTRSTDQLAPWLRGKGVLLPFSVDAVEAGTHARMTLTP